MPDNVDDRIPPTFPSAAGRAMPTAPPGTPELAASYAEFIGHLRAEIDRQATQLRAEQEHNRRLMAGYALARSAACHLLSAIARVPREDYDLSWSSGAVLKDINAGDSLVIPTVEG